MSWRGRFSHFIVSTTDNILKHYQSNVATNVVTNVVRSWHHYPLQDSDQKILLLAPSFQLGESVTQGIYINVLSFMILCQFNRICLTVYILKCAYSVAIGRGRGWLILLFFFGFFTR